MSAPASPLPYNPPPRGSKFGFWPWLALALFLVFGVLGLSLIGQFAAKAEPPSIGLIEVSGPISDSGASSLLGGTSGGARAFIRQVEAARADKQIKSVIIRINSPGGSASASQEMYEAVRRLRAVKPVVCSMGDVAASGGYYIAAACDKIYANRATTTGSIGVIAELLNYQELARKIGVNQAIIKSGKFKDAGNPARPLTPEERVFFQNLINNLYQQFVSDVVDGRKAATKGALTREKLLKLADGRVYSGEQAAKNGLIDETGGLYEATLFASQRGGLAADAPVKSLAGAGGLAGLFGAESSAPTLDSVAHNAGASFARGAMSQFKTEASDLPRPSL